jgi:hypothetical protein
MSQETFDAHEPAILADVKAIMGNPKSRKLFRLFELREKRPEKPGELLAEVFRTNYGPVIAHHSYGDVNRLRIVVVPGPVPDPARRGRGQGELVVAPLTNDPEQRFPVMANNFRYRIPVRNFRQ